MSFSSNSVIAKARAVFGRSLTAEDYARLSSKESVADVCAELKRLPRYEKALASANPQTIYRGQLEGLLRRAVFDIFESFRKFDFTESKGFFKYIVMRLEIEQILLAIQSVAGGASDAYIAALPMFLTDFAQIDLMALGRSRNLVEASEMLRGSVYSKAIGELLVSAVETGKLDIGECERRLYTQYYMRMLKAVDSEYKGSEQKELRRLILRSIDMENVVTLYRYSRIFKTDSEELPEKLIHFKYRLSEEVIERLAGYGDAGKIAAELSKLGYRLDSEPPKDVELLTERISLDFLKKTLRLSRSSSVVYFALTECLEIELKNIITIIEGIRYGLEGAAILDMLVT
ncbi:MAG: V-type ATPase subunit [Oscillospiraceae bacterium]|nr:V-type ATPase subunit [Oscillospiraceae bacterium]